MLINRFSDKTRRIVLSVLALLAVVVITVLLFIFRNEIESLPIVGYPVVFLMALLVNASLILPLPGLALASVLGANPSFHPFWLAVVMGLGATIGELTGYLAGYGGRAVIEKVSWYDRVLVLIRKYGGWIILLLGFIPLPLFDMAGIAAGALRMPVVKFMLWCVVGKILKMLVFTYAGSQIGNIFPWLNQVPP